MNPLKLIPEVMVAGGLLSCPESVFADQPNILVILADDLGSHDLSCQGTTDFKTPNIDRLAASGIRFAAGYVSAPQCGPSRAGLMTGISQSRFGYMDNYMHGGLPSKDRVKIFPEQMREQGYVTGIIGKWHIGDLDNKGTEVPENKPWERGFDYALTISGGLSHYFPYSPEGIDWMSNAHRDHRLKQKLENEEAPSFVDGLPPDTYLTDYFSTQAGNFIRRHADTPWFLYLAYNAPHTPMNAKGDLLQKYSGIPDETRSTLAAMMDSLDQGVGNVMRVLEETGQTRRTLVWFLSDNGGPTHHNASRNDPFSGKKGDVTEGGIRVPFMVSWPGMIPSNQVVDVPVTALDILPTSLCAAGAPNVPDVHDGRNLLPWLVKNDSAPEAQLFWSWRSKSAVRLGDLKETRNDNPVRAADGSEVPGHTFSNLKENPAELAAKGLKSPEQQQMLSRALNDWLSRVAKDQKTWMPATGNEAFGPVIPVERNGAGARIEDPFDRPDTHYSIDGRGIGSTWENSDPLASKWAVSQHGVTGLPAGNNTVLFNTALETDSGAGRSFSVQAEITPLQDNVWSGVAFHIQDPSNYYMFRFKSGFSNYQFYKVENGSAVKVGNGEIPGKFSTNRSYVLTVTSSEPYRFNFQITEKESGKTEVEERVEDAGRSFTGGYAGLYQGSAGTSAPKCRFDCFKLTVSP